MRGNILMLVSLLAVASAACGGATDETENNPGAGGSGGSSPGSTGGGGGAAGGGDAGSGTAGSGDAGSGTAGTGTAGTGTAGTGTAGSGGGSAGSGGGTAGTGAGGCSTGADCPQFDNGTQGYCVDGTCVYKPIDPCQGLACGAQCDSCIPGQGCPAVVTYCNAKGDCTPEQPFCGGGECKGPDDCPAPEGACKQCPNGKLSCPQPTCNNGQCGAQYPACESIECSSPKECPTEDGCAVCPDGSLSCPQPTCEGGKCGSFFPGCKAECSSPKECPAPKGPCQQCDDGTLSCPTATCEGGKCGVAYPGCGGVQCKAPEECPVPGVCQLCADGSASCAQPTCEGGKCGVTFPPCPGGNSCDPVLVKADPSCKKQLGYYWDGKTCQPLNGCECVGDCKKLVGTYDACMKLYSPCTDPPNPQCKSDADCPAPLGPCKACDDGSAACPKGICQFGKCGVEMGECKSSCAAMEAIGVGDCKKLLGFAWNGKDCVSLSGCECKGADCGKLAGTYEKCIDPYKTCSKSTPCSGKKCGDTCSTCSGDFCPGVVEYCNMKGQCTPEQPICSFP